MSAGRWRRIGIIGGLGPRASAHFYRLLIDLCSQKYQAIQDYDYPYMLLVSLASEGLCEAGLVNEEALMADIEEAFSTFKRLSVDVVAIACNSIYACLDRPSRHAVQLVNLPEEIATAASKLRAKDVGILCGRVLESSQVYDSYFLAKGIKLHYPESSMQVLIDRWAWEVMAGRYSTQTTKDLLEVVDMLIYQYDAVVLACSEISVLVDPFVLPSKVIDSMYILAEATLKLSDISCALTS